MNQRITTCHSCKEYSALIHWESQYGGYRGTCTECGGDWPESWITIYFEYISNTIIFLIMWNKKMELHTTQE